MPWYQVRLKAMTLNHLGQWWLRCYEAYWPHQPGPADWAGEPVFASNHTCYWNTLPEGLVWPKDRHLWDEIYLSLFRNSPTNEVRRMPGCLCRQPRPAALDVDLDHQMVPAQ